MGGSRATLGGKPVLGAVSWALTSGVRPYQTVVYLSHDDADALTGKGTTGGGGRPRPVDLEIRGGVPERSGTFKDVFVLHRVAAPIPKHAAVLVADRRWLWSRAVYRRSMNVRRRSGTKRLTSPNQLDATNLDPTLVYAAWSLRNATEPWTAGTLLDDLSKAIESWERGEGGVSPRVTVPALGDTDRAPIQDLELDGQLDECIERALAYLPGVDVTVDADGGVRFFKRSAADEKGEIEKLGQETQSGGHVEHVSLARIRPRKIRVYVGLEVELKVETEELASTGSTTDRVEDSKIWADNVLPIPDATLSVNGTTMFTGTWITMAQAFVAWGPLPAPASQRLDFPLVRRAMVPFNNLWNATQLLGQASPTQDWTSRLGAVQTHFRRTFRISKTWMDRIYELRAYRIATINPELGTRGDATVWSDFAYLATQRSMYAEANNGQALSYVMNVACYPVGGTLAADSIAAPATLTIVDGDQGVFTVSYNADPTRFVEQALPSQVEIEGTNTSPGVPVPAIAAGPSPYLRGRLTRSIAWDMLGRFHQPAALTSRHKLIAILTAVPASPNSKRALAYVDVTPTEVPSFPGQGSCEGPMMEVRVAPALETARVAWVDSQADRIRALFSEPESQPQAIDAPYPYADLVVNYEGSVAGGASLRGIAIAEAARILHSMADRPVGSAAYGFRAATQVKGWMTSAQHSLDGRGAVLTRVTLPDRIEPLALVRYLPASLRKILFRLLTK